MLRLKTVQRDFWEELLPAEALRLGPALQAVDTLLDDEVFLAPFRERFPAKRGRYTIPMETYLRLMYLKHKYQLGYESVVAEVTDSVSWRRFCRISLSGHVPDASTLIKLTNGPCQGLVAEVHDALVHQLAERKVLRGRRLRVDTTVVEAELHYPTDAGLLADGVRVITRTVKRLQQAGAAGIATFRDVGRSVQKRLGRIGRGLKQAEEQKHASLDWLRPVILEMSQGMVRRARQVQDRVVQWLEQQGERAPGRTRRWAQQLTIWLERTERVLEQTRQVLRGNVHIKDRLVSLFDPDARPIKKGKLKVANGTEFGYKVVVADEDAGFVTDYAVTAGNPSDSGLLVPAVKRHIARVGKAPHGVAVDRGMVNPTADAALAAMGVKRRCLPKTGKKTPAEEARERTWWFRRLRAFRAGGEGRISVLKRKYGWQHSRVRGSARVETWVGWGVVAHNLSKYAQLQAAKVA